MNPYSETPIQCIQSAILDEAGVKLLVKREDLNHPFIAGNKWWKLKYNLVEAIRSGHHQLLTFGGAYSNHIYATAALARENNLESVGVIRGEETLPLNPILTFAKNQGMKLRYCTREAYSGKSDSLFIEKLMKEFGNFYLIPEGGTNAAAIRGCEEWGSLLAGEEFDYLCLPVGTGGTMAGIIVGLQGKRNVIGYSVLKGGEFLREDVQRLTFEYTSREWVNWELNTDYHFGGYAKTEGRLMDFMDSFRLNYKIPIEPVYTAKMMFGIFDQVKNKKFRPGSTILALHTGGVFGQRLE